MVGPMNVRMENINQDSTPLNYVSFLTHTKRPKHRNADQDSLHSVSSVRSVVSTMSSLWSNLGMSSNSEQKEEKRAALEKEDLKYLYSAMTKIPALKFALDHRIRRIKGYEEFPFDTAVPVWAFKNLSVLEIVDLDFRSFFGWDRLAEQLRSLTLKRAGIEDLTDLLTNIVLDDMDKRRRRSAKSPASPVMAFSPPTQRKAELARPPSNVDNQWKDVQRNSSDASTEGSAADSRPGTQHRLSSASPTRANNSRRGSAQLLGQKQGVKIRRSSSSSSSNAKHTPHTSSSNLLGFGIPPTLKWRFLRHLSVADNGLTSISASSIYSLAQTLQSLDLSANLFTEVPDSLSILTSLRALNLSGCMIESLNSLSRNPLPAITVLNLRSNRLRSVAGIDKLYSLERLDLRCNFLTDPTELARLTGMPDFKDVYIAKNPFTKSHSNHRPQIFNLFRRTPGYTEDISIDSTGPRYNERKYLVERVPERTSVPVVKPPPEDDANDDNDDDDSRTVEAEVTTPRKSFAESSRQMSEPETPQTPTGKAVAKAKRKGARRRIVDMSQEQSPKSPMSSRSYVASPDAIFVTALQTPTTIRAVTQDHDDETPSVPGAEETDSKMTTPTSPLPVTPGPEDGLRAGRPDLSLTSEQYRSRIEGLKQEYGSGWLTAFNNEPNPFYHEPTSTPPGAVR